MNRKQIVRIEFTILLIVTAILVVLGVYGLISVISSKNGEKLTVTENSVSDPVLEEVTDSSQDSGLHSAQDSDSDLAQDELSDSESESDQENAEPDPLPKVTLSFAGDCTIGSLIEWQGTEPGDFQSVVGTNYVYPLSGVRDIFASDDLTIVNLEGTFTTQEEAVEKPYRFRADPSYVQVLTEGSVEAVSTSNNHSGDFLEAGLTETHETLEHAGILYTHAGAPLIRELDNGLTLGIVTYNTVENWEGEEEWRDAVWSDIETCKAADCDLIIGFMHWGTVEYLTEPEEWEVAFAHDMAEWGCDLIVGGHAHILQRMEYYQDVPIFYSMGNFCYGGHLNPEDKDSVIIQAEYTRDTASGEVTRTGLKVIPCLISGRTDANDYCPTPCQEGSEDYLRILKRLEWN